MSSAHSCKRCFKTESNGARFGVKIDKRYSKMYKKNICYKCEYDKYVKITQMSKEDKRAIISDKFKTYWIRQEIIRSKL